MGFDVDAAIADDLLKRLDVAERESRAAINLLWETSSVMARFESIGIVSKETAMELGMVGVAARACGLDMDSRRDHPRAFISSAIFRCPPGGAVISLPGRMCVGWRFNGPFSLFGIN